MSWKRMDRWVFCSFVQRLEGLHSHHSTKLFKDDKLKSCCWGKSGPDRHETTPERKRTFLGRNLDHTVNGIVVDSCIRRLVHQSRTDHVKRTDCTSHEETSGDRREEGGHQGLSLPSSGGDHHTLGLIVHSHFRSVQNHGTSNIRVDTTVETCNTLVLEELSTSLHDRRSLLGFRGHHFCLEHIKWVTGERSEGTSGTSGSKLLDEGCVLRSGASESNLTWLVQTKTKRGVRCFPKPSGIDTLPQSRDTFRRHNLICCSEHTKLSIFGRNLNTSLDDINRVDKSHSDHSCSSRHSNLCQETRRSSCRCQRCLLLLEAHGV
mmetsp:Transcript_24509/g.35993  ORF Transcript_24509/g.35993 Transcript_24509/m.35993 type:complete len:320 (+) Transcript_24509:106-1065(+)